MPGAGGPATVARGLPIKVLADPVIATLWWMGRGVAFFLFCRAGERYEAQLLSEYRSDVSEGCSLNFVQQKLKRAPVTLL